MIKGSSIITDRLTDIEPDRIFHDASGAGVIFGATGGVMEAALRTAYYAIMGENCALMPYKCTLPPRRPVLQKLNLN